MYSEIRLGPFLAEPPRMRRHAIGFTDDWAIANGTPALRPWKVGTHRVLAIYSRPNAYDPSRSDPDLGDNEDPQLPANVRETFQTHTEYDCRSESLPTLKSVLWNQKGHTSCKQRVSNQQRTSQSSSKRPR
jgi:hypothetical protein